MWEKKILEIVCGRLDFWLRLPNFGHTSLELQAENTVQIVYHPLCWQKLFEVTFKPIIHEYQL